MKEIKTVGELKKVIQNYDDDMPVWTGEGLVEGSIEYLSRVRKLQVDAELHTETFGTALPEHLQKTETGLVFY